jgi:outer membrane protein assembly factor BamB
MNRRTNILTIVLVLVTVTALNAENWPGWRGPRGDGTSQSTKLPMNWDGSSGENIKWKAPIPGTGHSSPVIYGDRIFVASCLPKTEERVLISMDRKTGKVLWQKTVLKARLEKKHSLNSFASGTPATDGETVIASFLEVDSKEIDAPNVGGKRKIYPGTMVVAAFDFDGNEKWKVKPGSFISAHGFCSCPVFYKDLVIINGDHDGKSYVLALKKETGEIAWKVPRKYGIRSYVTPLIRTVDGRTQMVFSGSKHIISLDPSNGKQHWMVEGPTEQFVSSMVFDGDQFYMCAGFPTYHVMAIDGSGTGDVTDTAVKWHVQNVRCYVPSPVVIGDYLIVADDRGTANCFDTKTGERHWQNRLGNHFSASLLAVNGLAYLLADDGTMKIVRPGKELEVVAENKLGEFCYASPAVAGDQLFIRGEKHLYCISK